MTQTNNLIHNNTKNSLRQLQFFLKEYKYFKAQKLRQKNVCNTIHNFKHNSSTTSEQKNRRVS